jgi:hypothetical protein
LRIVDLITEVRRTTVLYDNVHARWAERDNVRIWRAPCKGGAFQWV